MITIARFRPPPTPKVQASDDSPFPQTELPQFPPDEYKSEMTALRRLDKASVVAMLRRRSKGFSRGASRYRGVTRHHQPGKWEARVGRVTSGKYMVGGVKREGGREGIGWQIKRGRM